MTQDFLSKKISEIFERISRIENEVKSLEHILSALSEGTPPQVNPEKAPSSPSAEPFFGHSPVNKEWVRQEVARQIENWQDDHAKDHYDMEILGIRIKLDNELVELKKNFENAIRQWQEQGNTMRSDMMNLERKIVNAQISPSSGAEDILQEQVEARIQDLTAKTSKSVLMINAKVDHELEALRKKIENLEKNARP